MAKPRKISPKQEEKIVSLLKENTSYRNIVAEMEKDDLFISVGMVGKIRKKYNVKSSKLRVTTAVHRRRYLKRKDVVDHRIPYDFLTNIRDIYKWILKEYKHINRDDLELLLYLYPKYIFKSAEFTQYQNDIIYPREHTLFTKFMKLGLIKEFRKSRPPLYCLTESAKKICSDMHLACAGELDYKPKKLNRQSYFDDLLSS